MGPEPGTFPKLLERYLELSKKLEEETKDGRYDSTKTALSTVEQKIRD